MNIHPIPALVDPGWPPDDTLLDRAAENSHNARAAFEQTGYEMQTPRQASAPLFSMLKEIETDAAVELAQTLEGTLSTDEIFRLEGRA